MEKKILQNKYEIIKELGRGGMAIVYLAFDKQLKREVAVKMLHPYMNQEEHILRFEREAVILANLSHPNIVNIYEFFQFENNYYIIYEYIDGETLGEFLEKNSIKYPVIALMITYKIIEAIEYTHKNGIIHRDIKPDNIMISKDGQVKVMDFGIAKVLTNITVTDTGALLGSPAYMSPEQVMGGEITYKSDIFSIGVLIYKLITNISPFASSSTASTLKNVLNSEYTPIAHPLSDKGIERIIAFALNKDPNKRIKDLESFKTIINEKIKSEGKNSDYQEELSSFFVDPNKYQKNLRLELLEYYKKYSQKLYKQKNILKALNYCSKALELNPKDPQLKILMNKLKIFNNGRKIRIIVSFFVIMIFILFLFVNIVFTDQKEFSYKYKLSIIDLANLSFIEKKKELEQDLVDYEYNNQFPSNSKDIIVNSTNKLNNNNIDNKPKNTNAKKPPKVSKKKGNSTNSTFLSTDKLSKHKDKTNENKKKYNKENDTSTSLNKDKLNNTKIDTSISLSKLKNHKVATKYGEISYCFRPYAEVYIDNKKYKGSCINKNIKLTYGKHIIKAIYPYSINFSQVLKLDDETPKISIRHNFNNFSKVYLNLKSVAPIYISLKNQYGKYVKIKNGANKEILFKSINSTDIKLFFTTPGKYYLDITNKDIIYKNLLLNITQKRTYNIYMDLENDKNIKIQ